MNENHLHRDTSYDGVLEFIQNAILDGTYPPGMQLKQSMIASTLGVSQGPTREALVHLVSEGLVESNPYKGMFVKVITRKDVEEIYKLRAVLETLAIQSVLPTLGDKNFKDLEQIIHNILEAIKVGNHSGAVLEDLNFHKYLVELSGNLRLIKFWNSLLTQSRFALKNLYATQEKSLSDSLALNHTNILKAIRSGDVGKIRETLEEHMEFASSRLVQMLNSETIGLG
jgi:DNA-binding GntR family transcriptional regulator